MKKYLIVFILFFTTTAYSATPTFSYAPNNQNKSTSATADAPPVAAARPVTSVITQSNDVSTVTFLNSVSCNSGGSNTDNSYFRRFDLNGDHSVNNEYNVESIDFGVERATTSIPLTVNLYSIPNAAAFQLANLTLIGTATKNVSPVDDEMVVNALVNGSVNGASHDLVVEIFSPNQQVTSDQFFIGSNANGQTAPSYILAADCAVNEPTVTATIGFPDMHILMVVNGNVYQAIPSLNFYGLIALLLLLTYLGKNTLLIRKDKL